MAGNKYLLDTNIIAAILNKELQVETRLKDNIAYLCSITLGELYFGAYKSARSTENLDRINRLTSTYPVLVCDQMTADHYGQTKHALKQKGRPIPENDIWIAALALQHGFIL